MNYYKPKHLLNSGGDAKTIKGEKKGWKTYIMYLSPFKDNSKGINICSHASAGCVAGCLVGSGRGRFDNVHKARRNKTEYFLHDRVGFLNQLYKDLTLIAKRHKGEKIAIRLNGTSDVTWEKFKIKDNKNLMELFPQFSFYDYTKNHFRFEKQLPKNYSLVFSRSEINHEKSIELLNRGIKVAMVFDKTPKKHEGFKVVNGDENDLTFLRKKGVIIGLYFKNVKNKQQAFDSGFVIRTQIKTLPIFKKVKTQIKKAA